MPWIQASHKYMSQLLAKMEKVLKEKKIYELLEAVIKLLNKQLINIPMRVGFNVKIGKGICRDYAGKIGQGIWNAYGQCMISFREAKHITVFKLPPNKLFTWKALQESTNNGTVKYPHAQTVHNLVNQRYQSRDKAVNSDPGADVNS